MSDTSNRDDDSPISVTVPPVRPTGSGRTAFTGTRRSREDSDDGARDGDQDDGADSLRDRSEIERLRALRRGEGVEVSPPAIDRLIAERTFAAGAVFRRIGQFNQELGDFFAGVRPTLPPKLRGELLNPDGSPAKQVLIEVRRPEYRDSEGVGEIAWAARKAVTDARGVFSIDLSPAPVPQDGLVLRLRGQNATIDHDVARIDALDGDIGLTILDRTLVALQRSVISELADLVPVDETDAVENAEDFQTRQPPLVLGEGDCASEYATEGGTVSRYRYSVLFRLIDPLLGPKLVTRDRRVGSTTVPSTIPSSGLVNAGFSASDVVAALGAGGGDWSFRDRQPIEEPVDVDEFFDDVTRDPERVPKAATLGLGYVTKMRLVMVNQGLSLGKLVYSLPLAPGEEQQVAVFEQDERLSVRDRESLTLDERQKFEESKDTSLDATVSTAFDEMIHGDSKFETETDTTSKGRSGGFGLGVGGRIGKVFGSITGGFSGNFGNTSSDSSGSSNSNQNTSRDFLSETHENFSSAIERSASLKRRATRTGVRLANASDRQSATTKFIANRNHCHALTMQWFQVLRDYSIDTRVEGVQLVCFVPMQLIHFTRGVFNFPTLPENTTRGILLDRYNMILRYADVLRREFRGRRRYRRALGLLEDFAADPEMDPQGASPIAQDVVRFRVEGAFLPNDDISVAVVTKDGDRIGPVRIAGTPIDIDFDGMRKARDREQLVTFLRTARSTASVEYSGAVALPQSVDRSDIARVEVRRRTGSFAYRFDGGEDAPRLDEIVSDIIKNDKDKDEVDLAAAARAIDRLLSTSFSGSEFDDLIGAPQLTNVDVVINEGLADQETMVGIDYETTLPPVLPIPVVNVASILSRRDLRLIEDMYQHVIRNTVSYSKAVWSSMTEEERAILLERFTLGVPEGGLEDASSEIPLLSAVANKVLGFYGNMMIMPFHIPARLAEEMEVSTGDIQDAILRFHREGFRPPNRRISLPTRGLLGEAVLGRCNACETIDHRRFWNWQDSPTPPPVSATPSFPQGGGDVFSANAPASLLTNPPPTNLTIAGGDVNPSAAGTSALAEILKAAPELAKGGANLTGLAELQKQLQAETQSAATGRDKAIDASTDLTKDLVGKAVALATSSTTAKAAEDKKKEAADAAAKKKAEADAAAKAKQEKDAAAAEEAAFKKAVADLAKNAPAISALGGDQEDPGRFARHVLAGLPGGTDVLFHPGNVLQAAILSSAFTKANNEADVASNTELGSQAFLTELNSIEFSFGEGDVVNPQPEDEENEEEDV